MTERPDAAADVLVVGGGPAGLAAATELARRDRQVTVVDRGHDGVDVTMVFTPRAVAASRRVGIDIAEHSHPIERIRLTAVSPDGVAGSSTSTGWPRVRTAPDPGTVGSRHTFVERLRELATELGVRFVDGDAERPIVERGFVRGAVVRTPDGRHERIHGRFTVVADGGNSQFGRLLGTFRQPDWPIAVAHAADLASPLHLAGEIEIVLGLTDRAGTPISGYGWMFPSGRGTVGVGVMLMSSSPSFQVLNPAHVHARFVESQAARWQLDSASMATSMATATGGRIPMGTSVGPLAGPTYVIIGDAGAAANPLTGLGLATALETGVMAGDVVGEALDQDSGAALQSYPKLIDDRYGSYYKVGRLTDRIAAQPAVARRLHAALASRPAFADSVLRIAIQHLRGGRGGVPELLYRTARAASIIAPDA